MKNIVLFGPQEQEKVLCVVIKLKYDLFHISTGDVFRNNIKNNTDLGLLKGYMNKGELVPDEITINMLSEVVEKISMSMVYFRRIPKDWKQAIALDKLLGKFNTSIESMIVPEVNDEILINRLLEG